MENQEQQKPLEKAIIELTKEEAQGIFNALQIASKVHADYIASLSAKINNSFYVEPIKEETKQ